MARRHNEQIRKTQIIGVATQRKTKQQSIISSDTETDAQSSKTTQSVQPSTRETIESIKS